VFVRRLLITLTAVGGLFFTPVAALAEPGYPIEPPDSAVSRGTVAAGGSVIFSGKGFMPGEPISIDVTFGAVGAALHTTELPSRASLVNAAFMMAKATSSGTFSTRLKLKQSGRATLTATGTISGVVVNQGVTVVVAEPAGSVGSGEKLPVTGQPARHSLTEIGLGLGTILVGALLVFGAIRSRRREVHRT
jgi:hypothetical protein